MIFSQAYHLENNVQKINFCFGSSKKSITFAFQF